MMASSHSQRLGKEPMTDSDLLRRAAAQRTFQAPSPLKSSPVGGTVIHNTDQSPGTAPDSEEDEHVERAYSTSSSAHSHEDSTNESHGSHLQTINDPPAGTAAIEGYLVKRGRRNTRSWKKRWFEAFPGDDGLINYYTTNKKHRLMGRIYLQHARVESTQRTARDKTIVYGFTISTEKRLWQISAPSQQVASDWLAVLQRSHVSNANALIDQAEELMAEALWSGDNQQPFAPWTEPLRFVPLVPPSNHGDVNDSGDAVDPVQDALALPSNAAGEGDMLDDDGEAVVYDDAHVAGGASDSSDEDLSDEDTVDSKRDTRWDYPAAFDATAGPIAPLAAASQDHSQHADRFTPAPATGRAASVTFKIPPPPPVAPPPLSSDLHPHDSPEGSASTPKQPSTASTPHATSHHGSGKSLFSKKRAKGAQRAPNTALHRSDSLENTFS
eukprot:m.365623 g.365623  ORF g.365623 m.365623 type:complete len:441 (+) comp20818_c0_seq1:240-1562(+)